MRNLISLISSLLILSLNGQGQNPISIGLNLGGGVLYSSSDAVNTALNPGGALQRTHVLSSATGGAYIQKRLGAWAALLGADYQHHFLNHQDPNVEYFTSSSLRYTYKTRISNVQFTLAGKRIIELSSKIDLYGQLGFKLQVYDNSTVSQTIPANGAMFLPVTHALTVQPTALGMSPEMGIILKPSERFHWLLYVNQNIGLTEAFQGNVSRESPITGTIAQGEYSSRGSGTCLGLRLQYNFNVRSDSSKQEKLLAKQAREKQKAEANAQRKGNKAAPEDDKKITYDNNGLPSTLDNRTIEKQNEVVVRSTEIEFYVWDDKTEDNDSISLYINGEWVLKEYKIVNKKKMVRVKIDPDKDNYLIMYALNEGKFPPNTCAISIDDGTGEKRLNLKSTLKSCGALQFHYKPKENK